MKNKQTKKTTELSFVPHKSSNRSTLFNLFVLLDLIHFCTKPISKCRNCVFLFQFFWSSIFLLSSGHKRGLKKGDKNARILFSGEEDEQQTKHHFYYCVSNLHHFHWKKKLGRNFSK